MSFLSRLLSVSVLILIITFTLGCSTSVDDYAEQSPQFSLEEYFQGDIVAWGMVQDYSDKVVRRFCVEMTGTWQQDKGLLAETFYFDDGEESYRNWQLTRVKKGVYQGQAEDVTGDAFGHAKGFAFQWQYVLALEVDGTTYQLSLDDWMYQLDEYRLFNKTAMKKFGVTVANITLFFDKQKPLRTCK